VHGALTHIKLIEVLDLRQIARHALEGGAREAGLESPGLVVIPIRVDGRGRTLTSGDSSFVAEVHTSVLHTLLHPNLVQVRVIFVVSLPVRILAASLVGVGQVDAVRKGEGPHEFGRIHG
jgi:hypothetical protein